MRQPTLLELEIFVTIVFDWIAIGIEQRSPPVADRATTLIAILGVTNITTWNIEFAAAASNDDVRPFQTISMVLIRRIAEVDNHGVIQHVAVALWNGL